MANESETIKLDKLSLKEFREDNTVLIVVDMIKGFVEEGILSSPRVKAMSKNLLELNKNMIDFEKIFFIDSHYKSSTEFNAYPEHCLAGTKEEELIDGLKASVDNGEKITIVKKNSTNGFHAKIFKEWLDNKIEVIENYIVVGCVTDICVLQFVLSLKTYFNEVNKDKRVVVPANCVETFDIPDHNGDEMNLFALRMMKSNGVEVVQEIEI